MVTPETTETVSNSSVYVRSSYFWAKSGNFGLSRGIGLLSEATIAAETVMMPIDLVCDGPGNPNDIPTAEIFQHGKLVSPH